MGLLEDFKGFLPDISMSSVLNTGVILIIILITSALFAFGLYVFAMRLKFKKKIVIFEKINNRYEPAGTDTAMDFKVGLGGDTVLFLRKRKKYLPNPTIQTGRRSYWYAIREDGEWINIGIEDLDEKTKQMKIAFVDTDVRYSRTALQRNLRERYDKLTFMQKYGGMVAYSTLILVTCIGIWLVSDKMFDIVSLVADQVTLANQLAERQEAILGALDNICSTSGLRPAG